MQKVDPSLKERIITILYSFLSESKNVRSAVDLRNASENFSVKIFKILNSVRKFLKNARCGTRTPEI